MTWDQLLMHLLYMHPLTRITFLEHPSGYRHVELNAGTVSIVRTVGALFDAHDELHRFGSEHHDHPLPDDWLERWLDDEGGARV